MKIYVGNIAWETTEEELQEAFEQFGDVTRVSLAVDQETGKSRGYAFIEMEDNQAAREAIQALDSSPLNGRNIKVNRAKPRRTQRKRAEKAA